MAEPGTGQAPAAVGMVCGRQAHIPAGTRGIAKSELSLWQWVMFTLSLRRQCQVQPCHTPEEEPLLAGHKHAFDVAFGYKAACSKSPSSFCTHHAIFLKGSSTTKWGVGTELLTPTSSALALSLCSTSPGWGPTATSSPFQRSQLLELCINLLQIHWASCPDHGAAWFFPS